MDVMVLLHDPLDGICHNIKQERCRAEAKREALVLASRYLTSANPLNEPDRGEQYLH